MVILLFINIILLLSYCSGKSPVWCPEWIFLNGYTRDMGLLAEIISWPNANTVHGECAIYKLVYESNGIYDTRMRIYHSDKDTFITFRPAQPTDEGHAINTNKKMTDCVFLTNCIGRVHDRFQEAFLSLIEQPFDEFIQGYVFITGHGIGGSMQLFMGLWLWLERSIIPRMAFGFGGPFIGDNQFSHTYIDLYINSTASRWWQPITFNINNPEDYDHAIEAYQVRGNEIKIDNNAICGFGIYPLPIPTVSYGMHDLRQYRLYLQGTDCSP